MILSTHSVIGASFAGLLATDPATAFAVGLVSHYLFDTIPHWEYEIGKKNNSDGSEKIDLNLSSPTFIFDIGQIAVDLFLGLIIAYFFFVKLAGFSSVVVFAGVIGGLLPDFFQLLNSKIKNRGLVWFQKIHDFFHAEDRPYKKAQLKGALLQLGLVVVIVSLTFVSLTWLK